MEIQIVVDVHAPEDQVQYGVVGVATLERWLELPLAPFPGLRIAVKNDLTPKDPGNERWGELVGQLTDPTAMFEVESVVYFAPGPLTKGYLQVAAFPKYEQTLRGFNSQIAFLCEFYGFRKL